MIRKFERYLLRKGVCRVQFKKTSLLTKLLILVLGIYAVITLVNLQGRINQTRAEERRLQQEVAYAEQEHLALEEAIDELGTDKSIIKIARERLGMVADGEIVFFDSDD